MGKGGMSQGEGSKVEEENMSAWLVGLKSQHSQDPTFSSSFPW